MKNQDAQFILNAYRAGGQDASDPLFAEALRQAKADPALAQWMAREQAHAESMAGKLREVDPPVNLRGAILMGADLAVRRERSRRYRPVWLGLAAGLALAVLGSLFWPQSGRTDSESLANFVIADAGLAPHGRPQGTAAGDFISLLESPMTCLTTGLHFDFDTLRTTGCRTVDESGHDIVEVCFYRNGDYYHLYILKRSEYPEFRPANSNGPVERSGVGFASWADQNYYYMLVSRAGADAMALLL